MPDKRNFTPEQRTKFLNFINTRSEDDILGLLADVKSDNPQLTDFDPQKVSKIIVDTRSNNPFTNIIALKALPGVGWGSIRAIVTLVRSEMIAKGVQAVEPAEEIPQLTVAPEAEPEEALPTAEEPAIKLVEINREKIKTWDGFYKLATSEKYKTLFNTTRLLDVKKGVERLLLWADKEQDPSEDLQSKLGENLVKELSQGLGEVFAGKSLYSNYKPNNEQLFNEFVADILGEEVKTEKKIKSNSNLRRLINWAKNQISAFRSSSPAETTPTVTPVVSGETAAVVEDEKAASTGKQPEAELPEPNSETFNWSNLLKLAESSKYKLLFNLKVLKQQESKVAVLFTQDAITPKIFKQQFFLHISLGNGLIRDNFLKNPKLVDEFVQELFSGTKKQEEVIATEPVAESEPTVATTTVVTEKAAKDVDAIVLGETTYQIPDGFDSKMDEIFEKPPIVGNLVVYSEQITATKNEYKDNTPENKVWNDSVSAELRNISEYMGAYILILSTQGQYLVDVGELSAEALKHAQEVGEDKNLVVDLIKTSAKEFNNQCRALFTEAKAQSKTIRSIGELFSEEATTDLKKKITEIQIAVAGYLRKDPDDEDFVDTVVPEFSKYVAAVMSVGVKVV